ncbi:zf-TFIIB domain-containing protein [Piscinibacter koreensis]|uniref:zf-TFIIB domain-containing protein n=1 Tax=Piscinibacter koreensis TaxID=2742824 RepID=UPI003CC90A6E
MQCPVCTETQLVMTSRQTDYCVRCRGVCLDRGGLENIIERRLREQPVAALQPTAPVMPTSRDGKPAVGTSTRWGMRVALWAGVAAAASACTTSSEGRHDFYEGWRKAEVKRIEPFEKLAPHLIPGCESARTSQATAGSSWALVRYGTGRRSREVAVPVASADDYKIGELVYVNVSACARAVQRRSSAS